MALNNSKEWRRKKWSKLQRKVASELRAGNGMSVVDPRGPIWNKLRKELDRMRPEEPEKPVEETDTVHPKFSKPTREEKREEIADTPLSSPSDQALQQSCRNVARGSLFEKFWEGYHG